MQQDAAPQPGAPELLDESRDLDLGPLDVVLGILTLPLLFWALMYAVTGHERLYATPAARLRVYLVLLALQALVVAAGVVLWTSR